MHPIGMRNRMLMLVLSAAATMAVASPAAELKVRGQNTPAPTAVAPAKIDPAPESAPAVKIVIPKTFPMGWMQFDPRPEWKPVPEKSSASAPAPVEWQVSTTSAPSGKFDPHTEFRWRLNF